MSKTTPNPSKLDQYATLKRKQLAARKAAKQKVVDERWQDLTEYAESAEDRHKRLLNTPFAWDTFG